MSDDALKPTRRVRSVPEIPDYVIDSESEFLLYVDDTVVNGVRVYCGRDSEGELGGFLYGRYFQSGDRIQVEVTDFRPVESPDRGAGHFTFDHQAWLEAWNTKTQPSGELVGW